MNKVVEKVKAGLGSNRRTRSLNTSSENRKSMARLQTAEKKL